MKNLTLSNTTIKSYKNSKNETEYGIFKGKGKGSQLASTLILDEAILFNDKINEVEYRICYENETNSRGGAYFYKNTDRFFFSGHPFIKKGVRFIK